MSSEVPPHGPRIDEAATRAAGGSTLPGGSGISVGGWEIRTSKGPIAGEQACDALRASLGGAPALPEQLYGSSRVEATHAATGVTLSFSAEGALRAWMRAQGKGRSGGGEEGGAGGEAGAAAAAAAAAAAVTARPKVPAAERWRASRAREIAEHGAPELEYDWTFTCPYGGDVEVGRKDEEQEDDEAAAGENEQDRSGRKKGSRSGKGAGPKPAWLPTSDRLDRAALSARDPLLLWDEVLLCASELDDCGYSEVGVRIRAMPGRWFAVARCFVRVDGVLVRLLESRVVATFGGGGGGGSGGGGDGRVVDVLRETRHSEGEFRDLVAAGAPGFESAAAAGGSSLAGGGCGGGGGGGAYADADSAAQALSAVAPVGVTRFVTERLALVP